MNMKAITNYFRSSFEEMTKVVWPTKQKAVKLTIIVLVTCLVVAAILGVVDLGLNEGFKAVINLIAENK